MRAGAFLFLFCFILTSPLAEINALSFYPLATEVRVGILSKYALAEITLSGEQGVVFAGNGKYDISGKTIFRALNGVVFVCRDDGKPLAEDARVKVFFPGRYVVHVNQAHINQNNASFSRIYSGSLEINAERGVLTLVAVMKTDEYVRATVRSELGHFLADGPGASHAAPGWKNELFSALEIAVCSYIAAQKDRHPGKSYDFCDLTHCAHFQGLSGIQGNRHRNLLRIMTGVDGKPISGFFHTACGGVLTGPESHWGGVPALNYRRGTEDFCAVSDDFNWSVFFSIAQLELLTGAAGLEDITAEYREGRVGALLFFAKNGNIRMEASLFWSKAGSAYGWNKIRSNLFGLKKAHGGWNFSGRGFGHGVGLCMWGARSMAIEGKSVEDILNFFYMNPRIVAVE
ncbi:MAG: hypothetical protein FWG92_06095 [Leptospirales bacterium]|nr:hypothetical protein [Leptospirales bacterium]